MHHRTIQINHQPDAAIFLFIILTFIYSSTCFGRFPAHHQELNDCSGSLLFYLRIVVTVVLCSWSGRPAGRPDHEHSTYSFRNTVHTFVQTPFCISSGFRWLICSLLFFSYFVNFVFFPIFFTGVVGGFFWRDLISYGLFIFNLSICVLIILVRESVFRSGFFLVF